MEKTEGALRPPLLMMPLLLAPPLLLVVVVTLLRPPLLQVEEGLLPPTRLGTSIIVLCQWRATPTVAAQRTPHRPGLAGRAALWHVVGNGAAKPRGG